MNDDRIRAVRQLMLDHGGDDSTWWATLADGIVKLLDVMERPEWVVWSNQHSQWWRPNRAGYTNRIEEAGRYSLAEAEAIVRQATVDGQLFTLRQDPYTGRPYRSFDEVMLPAPVLAVEPLPAGAGTEARQAGRPAQPPVPDRRHPGAAGQ